MTPDSLNKAIDASTLAPRIAEALNQWPDADTLQAEITNTLEWVGDIIKSIQGVFSQLEDTDEAELRTQAAIAYIELKSRWIALNTKINYQTFRNGSCAPSDAFRGSSISIVLAALEEKLNQEDIDQITTFLAEPVRSAA